MKINRKALLDCLNSVRPGLATKETTEQSTSFIFHNGQVITYNNEIAVHAPFAYGFEIHGAVPAKELLNIISRFNGDEVEFDIKESEVRLKSGKSKAGIKLEAEISLPIDELKIPKKWTLLPKDFIKAVQSCLPSASKSLSFPILSCIHITNDFVESTDDARLSRFTFADGDMGGLNDLLLTYEITSILSKFDAVKYHVEDGFCHFINEAKVIFSCRTSDGEYPDLEKYLKIKEIGTIEFPSAMLEMLDKAGVFLSCTSESDYYISITVDEKGLMTVRGEGDFGWYEESCRTKWAGNEGIKFHIHPIHLAALVKDSKTAQISENRIKFSTGTFEHLVGLEVD